MRVLLVLAPAFGLNGVVTRRELGAALGGGGALGAGAVAARPPCRQASASAAPTRTATRTLPDLPYAYDALEPYIDAATMKFHHDKHHAAYIANANKALGADAPSVTDIQKDLLKSGPRNAAGGHYNHCLFWNTLSPAKDSGAPSAALAAAIDKAFGSMDGFKEKFSASAAGVFGSGWAWLGVKDGGLVIVTSPNQDNPLMTGEAIPILGIDVWEHAYYLLYQNRRPDYIAAFYNVINWAAVSKNFDTALAGSAIAVSG